MRCRLRWSREQLVIRRSDTIQRNTKSKITSTYSSIIRSTPSPCSSHPRKLRIWIRKWWRSAKNKLSGCRIGGGVGRIKYKRRTLSSKKDSTRSKTGHSLAKAMQKGGPVSVKEDSMKCHSFKYVTTAKLITNKLLKISSNNKILRFV